MRLRVTVFLLLANALTAFLIWKIEGGRDTPPAIATPLFTAGISEITVNGPGVAQPYTLARHQHGWRVTAPFVWEAGPAADFVVEQLRFLKMDGGFTLAEARASGSSPANYGLDKPAATISVRGEGAANSAKILIGLVPASGGVYLLTEDDHVIPASRKFYDGIVLQPGVLRANTVFNIEPFQVRAIAVRAATDAGEKQIRLKTDRRALPDRPDTERVWRFEAPVNAEANLPRTDAWVAALAGLRCLDFQDPPPNTALDQTLPLQGLAPPSLRITLEANDRVQTLLVGSRVPGSPAGDPARYAKLEGNGTVFTLREAPLRDWREADAKLREPQFFRFHPEQLVEITIHGAHRDKLVLSKRAAAATAPAPGTAPAATSANTLPPPPSVLPALPGDPALAEDAAFADWQIPALPGTTAKNTLAADPDAIAFLVQSLRHLTAMKFLSGDTPPALAPLTEPFVNDAPTAKDLAALGFNKPARRVELVFKDGTRLTLLAAPPSGPGTPWHAKLETAPAIYSVRLDLPDILSTDPGKFRDRLVAKLPDGAAITGLKILDLQTKKTVFAAARAADDANWAAATGLPAADRPRAAELATALAALRAREYAPAPFARNYKHSHPFAQTPDAWRYRLETTFLVPGANAAETRELLLTRRIGGTLQVAGSPKHGCIFEIEQPLIDALHPLTSANDEARDAPNVPAPPDIPPPR